MKLEGIFKLLRLKEGTTTEHFEALPNTVLVFASTDSSNKYDTVTNSKGFYSIELPAGDYVVRYYRNGTNKEYTTLLEGTVFTVTDTSSDDSFNLWLESGLRGGYNYHISGGNDNGEQYMTAEEGQYLEQKIETVESKVSSLESDLVETVQNIKEIQEYQYNMLTNSLKGLSKAIASVDVRVTQINDKIDTITEDINTLRDDVDALKTK